MGRRVGEPMSLRHTGGLDHVVILVRDLAAAAEGWRRLGFTLSARGTHSEHKGTGNHTAMLGPDYLELLGILAPTPLNGTDGARLDAVGEGLDRVALRTADAVSGLAEIRGRGQAGTGPQSFARPVRLPDGTVADAAFRTFEWPDGAAPAGLRLFACQHLTPDAVWVPGSTDHPNTAKRIARLDCLSVDPRRDAELLADLLAAEPVERDGCWTVPTGPGRADVAMATPAALASRYPGLDPAACRRSGAATLVLAAADLGRVARLVPAAERAGARLLVPPGAANGVALLFEEG